MDIVEESFTRLFPDAEFGYEAAVSYSGKFKPYNATVRRIGIRLFFSFSHILTLNLTIIYKAYERN